MKGRKGAGRGPKQKRKKRHTFRKTHVYKCIEKVNMIL